MTTPLTREEYEDRRRRLRVDIEDASKAIVAAGKAIVAARAHYDAICDDLCDLRIEWNKQQMAAANPKETP